MISQLNRFSSRFINSTGSKYQLDHNGVLTDIPARRWAVANAARLATASGNIFFAARNVYEFLTPADNSAAAGDIVTKYSNGAPGDEKFFLYSDYQHEVSDTPSYKKFFALRINISVDFYAVQSIETNMGGSKNSLADTPFIEKLPAHFWEAKENIDIVESLRTENFAGVLVTQKDKGIEILSRCQINEKWYEVQGFDTFAIDGIQINRLDRVK